VDKDSLVERGRVIVKGLQDDGVPLTAALWVREISDTGGDNWLLWLAPKNFLGRTSFYSSLSKVLTKLQLQIGYFEIANVRTIAPTSSIIDELRRFGPIRSDQPRYLFNQNLGGTYVQEAIVLHVA
jgi:hypothetical protein